MSSPEPVAIGPDLGRARRHEAIRGRSVIQLELMAEAAGENAERLVELGSAVAGRIE